MKARNSPQNQPTAAGSDNRPCVFTFANFKNVKITVSFTFKVDFGV